MNKKKILCGILAFALTSPAALAEPAPSENRETTRNGRARASADRLNDQERKMLTLAKEFARHCENSMEAWITNEETTQAQLFGFLYYPVKQTDPVKFRTDWDRLADRDIRGISDKILKESASLIFAVLVDKNGYLPAHNTRYSQPLTGNSAVDLVNNRTKRIFADTTGLAAARNKEKYLIQRYQRDTGEKMADLSVPIYIQGKKWGAVRLGYRASTGR